MDKKIMLGIVEDCYQVMYCDNGIIEEVLYENFFNLMADVLNFLDKKEIPEIKDVLFGFYDKELNIFKPEQRGIDGTFS